MYYLEKEFAIACSHRLHNPKLSSEENKKLFGKCNNYPSHGHTFKIVLKLKTEELNKKTGMIRNFYDLKEIFKIVIDDRFDHKFLNDDVLFKDKIVTSENICNIFYHLLKPHLIELYGIKVYESDTSSAEYIN